MLLLYTPALTILQRPYSPYTNAGSIFEIYASPNSQSVAPTITAIAPLTIHRRRHYIIYYVFTMFVFWRICTLHKVALTVLSFVYFDPLLSPFPPTNNFLGRVDEYIFPTQSTPLLLFRWKPYFRFSSPSAYRKWWVFLI